MVLRSVISPTEKLPLFLLGAILLCILQGVQVRAAEAHNVIKCTIIAAERRAIRTFPGQMCAFLADGRVIASSTSDLMMYGPKGGIVWNRRNTIVHHQLNLNGTKTRILALSEEARKVNGQWVRYDVALIFDIDGKRLGRFSFYDHRKEIARFIPLDQRDALSPLRRKMPPYGVVPYEYSHANSLYEIPENTYEKANAAFQHGNYILNALEINLMLVLDRELKKILWTIPFHQLQVGEVHDVQVLPNGHLLYYENYPDDQKSRKAKCCASLVEYDLSTHKVVWRWHPSPRSSFKAPHFGGVQLLENGNLLFNDSTLNSVREITREGSTVWELDSATALALGFDRPFQQAKRYDLSEFLKNNNALISIFR